jgi:uncharacterized protein
MRPLVLALALTFAADIPFLSGRVVDDANIISDEAQARLTATLKAHEDATTNQVVVLTVTTISGQSIEEYAVKVFEAWKLGNKEKDNGVLVVVVPEDRKMRIEVGYGLEGVLPDGAAGEIIRTWMTPAFKAGNYEKGLEDGVAAIISRLEGRGDPADRTPVENTPSGGSSDIADMPWTIRILIGAFVFGIIGLFTVIGVLTPGVGWFLYLFLIPFWAIFPLFIIGARATMVLLAAYLLGYPIAKLSLRNKPWYKKAGLDLRKKGRATIGGFTFSTGSSSSSDSDSGSSWSSSSSSDSFSGGGGSSGGGGASGSW